VRVNRVIVCVVVPWCTSSTFTGILDGLDPVAGVAVGVTRTDGVPFPGVGVAAAVDGVFVAFGVAVAVGDPFAVAVALGVPVAVAVALGVPVAVAVAVAVVVGVGVEVEGPSAGFDVAGSLLSTDSISLIAGFTPFWKFDTVTTVTVLAFPPPLGTRDRSS
jgi:hypothetical protein